MKFTTVFTPFALVPTTVLGHATIIDSLKAVNEQTLQLQQVVAGWKGNLLGLLPITKESTDILTTVAKGTEATKKSEPLDFPGALGVAEATSVNSSLTALIAAKPKFDKLKVSPIVLISLGLQKKATEDMSAAIVDKVPADLKSVAEELIKPIEASFELAIDTFHPF